MLFQVFRGELCGEGGIFLVFLFFHSYGIVTIANKGLQIFTYYALLSWTSDIHAGFRVSGSETFTVLFTDLVL